MVAAVTTTGCSNSRAFPKSPSSLYHSKKDNASITEAASGGRRPRSKEITSRYLASSILSSSKSNSSCIPTMCSSSTPPRSESVDSESDADARTVLRSTTRSLSVSFQGESFFFQTRKAEHTPRKPSLECREANAVAIENSQPERWPKTRARESNSATSRLDCSTDEEHSLLVNVQLLHHSLVFDEVVNFNIGDRTQSLDCGSFSSGSNSSLPVKVQGKPRGKQQPLSSTQMASPRLLASSPCGPVNSSSPRGIGVSRIRRNITERYSNGSAGNAPSIISFASEVRRKKKGESRIEDAHLLRLFDNRYLQWRYINARAENTISTQMMNTKNNLYYAWMTISELRSSAMNKRIILQVLRQNLKLASILKGQIVFQEEWSTLDEGHETSFKGAIEALKASTLHLPVIGGAKVDIKEVKDAVSSAIGIMQSMMASICSFLSKVEGISSLVAELGKAVVHEQALLNQSRDLLSIVAALHVKQTSIQSYMLQLKRNNK